MATPEGDPLVLVSGATGFVATHVIKQLQQQGYRVRGTVRSLKNEKKVNPIQELCPDARVPVELVEAELTDENCWKEAVKDCTYIIHVASPLPPGNPRHEDDVIKPAVEGTLNILKAAQAQGGIKRVVVTSSLAAINGGQPQRDQAFDENVWTDLTNPNVSPYYKSKTLAEKAAWDFVKELPEEEKFELAVINPGVILGPILSGGAYFTSLEGPKRILEPIGPFLPAINMPCIDVRDVALAHIRAMTVPGAAGYRHILSSQSFWFLDLAKVCGEEFGPQGYKVPTRTAPYFLMKLISFFDQTVKMLLPELGKNLEFKNTRMMEVLEIDPIDIKTSIIDMCYDAIEHGYIKKTARYKGRPTTK